jgi:hypothetical protein
MSFVAFWETGKSAKKGLRHDCGAVRQSDLRIALKGISRISPRKVQIPVKLIGRRMGPQAHITEVCAQPWKA